MTILSDIEIEKLCVQQPAGEEWIVKDQLLTKVTAEFRPMIRPFISVPVRVQEVQDGDDILHNRKVLSFGLSGYGYDVRLDRQFKIFSNLNGGVIDPKRFDARCLVTPELRVDEEGAEYVILPPNSYLLGTTMEYFSIPRDVVVVAVGKSTYARCGAIVNVTPIEPGFEGNVVIEVSNSTPSPLRIYAQEGIAQFLFYKGAVPCRTSYADKGGKYQGQTGVTLPKV